MFLKKLKDCSEFLAGDHTILRELVHPEKASLDLRYSVAHGRLTPGARSKRHRLTASEVYYFLAGKGLFHLQEQVTAVEAGLLLYVPPGTVQWLENTGSEPLEFLCLVEPAWRAELEEVLE